MRTLSFVLAFLASSTIAAPLAIGTTDATTGDLVARDGPSGACPPGYGNGCNPPPRQRAGRGEEVGANVAARIEARSPLLGLGKKKPAAKTPPAQASACTIAVTTNTGSSFNVRAKPNDKTTVSSAGVPYTLETSPTCEVTGKLPDGFSAVGSINGWKTAHPDSNRRNNQFDNRRGR